jgi:hypothetical protein
VESRADPCLLRVETFFDGVRRLCVNRVAAWSDDAIEPQAAQQLVLLAFGGSSVGTANYGYR